VLFHIFLPTFAVTNQPFFVFTPPWFWFISGLVLIIGDLLFLRKVPPNFRFIPLSMGAGAIFQSIILWQCYCANWIFLLNLGV
jgi:hypothetical protein